MGSAWVQRHRRKQLEAANRLAKTCQRREGRYACGGPLRDEVDRIGRLVRLCAHCERRKAGVCRHCPRAVEGKIGQAIRCARCREIHTRRYNTAYAQHYVDRHNASARESYRRRTGYYDRAAAGRAGRWAGTTKAERQAALAKAIAASAAARSARAAEGRAA
jgi:hypothetical protein